MTSALLKLMAGGFAISPLASMPAAAIEGEIRQPGGKCLDIDAPDIRQDGGRVRIWSCTRQPGQIWHYNKARGTIRNDGGLCLDAHAPDIAASGGRVRVWTCNATPRQRWTFNAFDGRIQNASGLCLDAPAPEQSSDGGRVQMRACNNQPRQRWGFAKALALPAAQWPLKQGGSRE